MLIAETFLSVGMDVVLPSL